MGGDCLVDIGFPFEVMKILWKQTGVWTAQHCECTKYTELRSLMWLIFCYDKVISILKRKRESSLMGKCSGP